MTGSATVQASAPSLCVEGVAGSRAIVAVPVAIIVAVGTVWMTLLWAEAAGQPGGTMIVVALGQ